MREVKVKDRTAELEEILKHVSGMEYESYRMQLDSLKQMEKEGKETFIEIDPKEDFFLGTPGGGMSFAAYKAGVLTGK